MKTAEAKNTATQARHIQKESGQPFFNKGGQGGFFSNRKSDTQPFFQSSPSPFVQTKLTIGQPGDKYEREADAKADEVVRHLAGGSHPEKTNGLAAANGNTVQAKCAACEQEEQVSPKEESVQRKPIFESASDTAIQPQMGPPAPIIQRQDEAAEMEEEQFGKEEEVQMKPIFDSGAEPPDEDKVQRKCSACEKEETAVRKMDATPEGEMAQAQPNSADLNGPSSSLESRLNSSKGGGSSLPEGTRSQMEGAFGTDFSSVRVHTDSSAVQMNKELGAHAFTHGSDIYFNAGKYDTGSSDGQRLLAHELTHTVQQGGAGRVRPKLQKAPVQVQKNGATTGTKKVDLKDIPKDDKPKEGYMEKGADGISIHIHELPAKQYASMMLSKAEADQAIADKESGKGQEIKAIKLPKPGKRKSRQSAIWKSKMGGHVYEALKHITPEGLRSESRLSIEITAPKNQDKPSNKNKAKLIGDLEALAKEIIVPFWNMGGEYTIHQVEHKIDYQILGPLADLMENFILIDAQSNIRLGGEVKQSINSKVENILGHYRPKVTDSLASDVKTARRNYTVFCHDLIPENVQNASVLSQSSFLNPGSATNPINKNLVKVRKAEIPSDHFLLKTSKDGAGYIVPLNFSNDVLEIEIDETKQVAKKAIYKKVIKDKGGNFASVQKSRKLKLTNEGHNVFKLDTRGYAGTIKNIFRLKDLSPIELNDDIEINPFTGLTATGKVKTDIPFLQNTDINFFIENSNYTLEATVPLDKIKDKFPGPFNKYIDYCSLTLAMSSNEKLSIGGAIGFHFKDLGMGTISAKAGSTGFALAGDFQFNENKAFSKAELGFDYSNKKWGLKGGIEISEGKITGIKRAGVTLSYGNGILTGNGSADLSVPGISTISLTAVFENTGKFKITGSTQLKNLPGISSGSFNATVAKGEKGFELSATGTATPKMPKVPNLSASFTVGYNKGAI